MYHIRTYHFTLDNTIIYLFSSNVEVSNPSLVQVNTDVQMGSSGKPKLSGEEFAALKQRLKEQSKKIKSMVTFRLREVGETAQLKTEADSRVPLFLADIQHLIMYSQVSKKRNNVLI